MAYTNYEELIARYPVVKDWGKRETDVNSDLIYFAEIEINGRFGTHFSVPFDAAHPTIKDLTIDMAYYRALLTKQPKEAKAFHDRIVGRIDAIKKGEEVIYTGSGTNMTPSITPNAMWSNVEDYHPAFSMLDVEDSLTQISSQMISDLEDERGA